jgi:hypothetical protein
MCGACHDVRSYLSFGQVPEWKGVDMKYTRKP